MIEPEFEEALTCLDLTPGVSEELSGFRKAEGDADLGKRSSL